MSTPVKPGCSPLLAEALQRRNMLCRAETGGRAALLQLTLAGLCLYDANNLVLLGLLTSQPAPLAASLLYLVEMSLFAVLATSFLSSLWTLLAPLHSLAPLSLTDQQFRLLRLHPSSPGFTKSPESTEMKLTVEGLEKERDFYFGEYLRHLVLGFYPVFPAKLRDVEVLCQENEGVGGDLVKKVRILLIIT